MYWRFRYLLYLSFVLLISFYINPSVLLLWLEDMELSDPWDIYVFFFPGILFLVPYIIFNCFIYRFPSIYISELPKLKRLLIPLYLLVILYLSFIITQAWVAGMEDIWEEYIDFSPTIQGFLLQILWHFGMILLIPLPLLLPWGKWQIILCGVEFILVDPLMATLFLVFSLIKHLSPSRWVGK